MAKSSKIKWSWLVGSRPYWMLVTFLLLTFVTGGGSRADIRSLVILRPAAVIFCGIGLWSLKWEHVKAYRFLFGMAAGIFALVGSHLIPLPPALWETLPGREIITEIDKLAELGEIWRPISMVPSATWNALYSLFVPLAVLVLGVQLSREERFKLLPVLLSLGLFSGFWGILQVVGDARGPLYLYNITNNGEAVGLFSNRNHQAMLLASLFSMLAVYACSGVRSVEQANARGYLALAAGAVLVPLLLVTGSRAGLAVGVIGAISIPFLYRKPTIIIPKKRDGKKTYLSWIFGGFAALCLGALTLILSRAEAVHRLLTKDETDELRFQMWPYIADMAWKYFPVGSGVGSFVEAYQIDEPQILLDTTYVNHAHNDWLELYMTTGIVGLIMLGLAVFAFGRSTLAAFNAPLADGRDISFARLGATIIFILAVGSIGDYPLRAPSIACLFVIATLWLTGDSDRSAKNAGALR